MPKTISLAKKVCKNRQALENMTKLGRNTPLRLGPR